LIVNKRSFIDDHGREPPEAPKTLQKPLQKPEVVNNLPAPFSEKIPG
jgi:hypothetical protein